MSRFFTESEVESSALAWLESLGYAIRHGLEIAPGEPDAERDDYGQVVLERRLRHALARLNPGLPAEALDDAFRRLTRADAPTLEGRNHLLHRLLVDGVTVPTRPTAANTTLLTASPATCATRCPTPRSSAAPARPSS